MELNNVQQAWCDQSQWDFSNLRALFINTTLNQSPVPSHTEGLWQISKTILQKNRTVVDEVRLIDRLPAFGVYPDMTKHGWDEDVWPELYKQVLAADILIIGTPIWLGERSSLCSLLIERLYANSADLNAAGQAVYYGKVGGCVITGNEDGAKHCAMSILYSLQHIGYVIPPQADCYWLGEAGPGPSYLDENSGGPENDFTNRNATFMTWNLLHLARTLKDVGGVPAHGNQPSLWKAGCRFDSPNPEYR